MKTVILVFGSEVIKSDNLALNLYDELREEFSHLEFVKCFNPEDLYDYLEYDQIYILDVIEGIDDVQMIKDLNLIKEKKLYTIHDLDLGFTLKLMKKLGKSKKIKVIGIPMKMEKKKAKQKVEEIIELIQT